MSYDSIVLNKSRLFATRIIRMCEYLSSAGVPYPLVNQVLRSGTSIGANLSEAVYASSKKDFCSKIRIALREGEETLFWLTTLHKSNKLTYPQYNSMAEDLRAIIRMLIATLKKCSPIEGKDGKQE